MYVVQVSDTTMMAIAASLPEQKDLQINREHKR